MSVLRKFVDRFGVVMALSIIVSCGIWAMGLIILPQILMFEKSFIYRDQAAVASISRGNVEIDRLFVDKGRIETKLLKIDKILQSPGAINQSQEQKQKATSMVPFSTSSESIQGDREQIGQEQAELEAEKMEIEQRVNRLIQEVESAESAANPHYSYRNYADLFGNKANLSIFVKTIWSSVLVTFIAFVVCYPIAFYIAKVANSKSASLLILALIVPYWVNEILRIFAWLMILADQGTLNQIFLFLNLIDSPIDWRSGNTAVIIGMVYAYILFMIFPIYNTVDTLDSSQIEAARDLGSPWWLIHWAVVLPHAKPGIAVGCIMTFMLAAGSYAVPAMLGSTTSKWFTEIIYDQFYEASNWALGSAYAFALLIICITAISLVMRVFRVGLQDIAK